MFASGDSGVSSMIYLPNSISLRHFRQVTDNYKTILHHMALMGPQVVSVLTSTSSIRRGQIRVPILRTLELPRYIPVIQCLNQKALSTTQPVIRMSYFTLPFTPASSSTHLIESPLKPSQPCTSPIPNPAHQIRRKLLLRRRLQQHLPHPRLPKIRRSHLLRRP